MTRLEFRCMSSKSNLNTTFLSTMIKVSIIIAFLSLGSDASKLRGENHLLKNPVLRKLKGSKSSKGTTSPTQALTMSQELEECSTAFASKLIEYESQFCEIWDEIDNDYSYNPLDYTVTQDKAQTVLDDYDFSESAILFAECVLDEGDTKAGTDMIKQLKAFQEDLDCLIQDCNNVEQQCNFALKMELKSDFRLCLNDMIAYIANANLCLDTDCELAYPQCP